MALIKSISGFRGTIGGAVGDNLTPQDIVECTAAYGQWLVNGGANPHVVIGRDARISGELVSQLVISTLRMMGIRVSDLGLSTTPTVEMAVPKLEAGGGIILTASHNPKQWNALKLLNAKGEFISGEDGKAILAMIGTDEVQYAMVDKLGAYEVVEGMVQYHIDQIFALPLVKVDAVKEKSYKVVVDAINSTGALSIVPLLEQMGCEVIVINGEMTGQFAHNPEPLKEHLAELSEMVGRHRADMGIAVDPDVDRLCFVSEDGELFGEEYTLVAVADYILRNVKGTAVSNLSSSRALRDVARKHDCEYFASAVGEVNVVQMMKDKDAVIGGEGNGGIIYPELHYGRDALVGVALLLSYLTEFGKSMSFLRSTYPSYSMSKNKIQLTPELNVDDLLNQLGDKYAKEEINTLDGLKIDFEDGWIHLRKSNTEPIIRIYTESTSVAVAERLAAKIKQDVQDIVRNGVNLV